MCCFDSGKVTGNYSEDFEVYQSFLEQQLAEDEEIEHEEEEVSFENLIIMIILCISSYLLATSKTSLFFVVKWGRFPARHISCLEWRFNNFVTHFMFESWTFSRWFLLLLLIYRLMKMHPKQKALRKRKMMMTMMMTRMTIKWLLLSKMFR